MIIKKVVIATVLLSTFMLSTKESVIELTQNNFRATINQKNKPIVVKVYATWCSPCTLMAPIFQKTAWDLEDSCSFAQINIETAEKYRIPLEPRYIPAFFIFKNGKLIAQYDGKNMIESELKLWIKQAIA